MKKLVTILIIIFSLSIIGSSFLHADEAEENAYKSAVSLFDKKNIQRLLLNMRIFWKSFLQVRTKQKHC